MIGMNNIARSRVGFLRLPRQVNIRPLLLRSSIKNSRAPVIATRFVTSGAEVKSAEEQKLEWEYCQIMCETPKPGMVNQLKEWANPTVFSAALIVAIRGFDIFQKSGLQELAAFVGLVGILVSAAKYAVGRLSNIASKLDRVPFMLAKLHSGLKSEVKTYVDDAKAELLKAIQQSKS